MYRSYFGRTEADDAIVPRMPDGALGLDDLVAVRRDLHRHPELRFDEHRTAGRVASTLRDLGFEVNEGIAGTGVVSTLRRGSGSTHVGLRADMDALPIPEDNAGGYGSEVPGVSHACGHDVHVTAVLGAATVLAARDDWEGQLSLIFQPAEEVPFGATSGAREMIDCGALDRWPSIDALFALHCWPWLDVGTLGIEMGPAMAAKDAFAITVHGAAAHVATPHEGVDAILVASRIVHALHQLSSRRLPPGETAVVHVGTIEGGRSQSVLADEVRLTGTIRTQQPTVRADLRACVERIAAAEAAMWATEVELVWANEMPPVINDARLIALATDVLTGEAAQGLELVRLKRSPLTADDFALFAERVPGLYLKLGVRGPDRGRLPLHASGFDIDERALMVGVRALERLAHAALAGRLTMFVSPSVDAIAE